LKTESKIVLKTELVHDQVLLLSVLFI